MYTSCVMYILNHTHFKNESTPGHVRSMTRSAAGGDGHKIYNNIRSFWRGWKHDRFSRVCHYSIFYEIFAYCMSVCNIVVVTITPPSAVTTYARTK